MITSRSARRSSLMSQTKKQRHEKRPVVARMKSEPILNKRFQIQILASEGIHFFFRFEYYDFQNLNKSQVDFIIPISFLNLSRSKTKKSRRKSNL